MPEGTVKQGIGASVRRKEDKRFLIGKGNYTDDINRAGQLHVYFLRSPVAFADIISIDKQSAEKASGVAAILTGEDVAADNLGGPICGWAPTNKDGSAPSEPPHPNPCKWTGTICWRSCCSGVCRNPSTSNVCG